MPDSTTPVQPPQGDPLGQARQTAEQHLNSDLTVAPPDSSGAAAPASPVPGTALTPSGDERLVAAICHLLAFLSSLWLPLLLNAIIFVGWRDRSRYVAFQAAQALAFNLVLAFASSLLLGIVLASFFLWCMAPLLVAFIVCAHLYALWGTLQTANGNDFSYLIVGPIVADMLDRRAI